MKTELEKAINERILILDGAMGTMIQRDELTEDDFREGHFENHSGPPQYDCVLRIRARLRIKVSFLGCISSVCIVRIIHPCLGGVLSAITFHVPPRRFPHALSKVIQGTFMVLPVHKSGHNQPYLE